MAWWDTLSPGKQRNVVLLQVDLAGHSQWVTGQSTDIESARRRTEFAVGIEAKLRYIGFDRLYWLGDGGLFGRLHESVEDAEAVCRAADDVFNSFNAWRKPEEPVINIRVTATYVSEVSVDPVAGYWCSPRMNAFLKYERDIALKNSFVITEDLWRKMDPHRECYGRFSRSRRVTLPSGEIITVWVDSKHPHRIQPSPKRFLEWLRGEVKQGRLLAGQVAGAPAGTVAVGDCVVMDSALEIGGYGTQIELVPSDARSVEAAIFPVHREQWSREREELVHQKVHGTKASVAWVKSQLEDDPLFRLWWWPVSYTDLRAFHKLMEIKPEVREEYIRKAVQVFQDGSNVPTTIGNHIVVLLANAKDGRDVLIAHRRKGGRPGTYTENFWSFSIEEMFNPIRVEREGRTHEADTSVQAAMLRGVREELVGAAYDGPMRVYVDAFILEGYLVNFSFLGIVDLPEITFADLKERWPDARDAAEHDALAALPLEDKIIGTCMASPSLPEEVWLSADKFGGNELAGDDHRWHPSSRVRMALALWHGQIRKSREG